MAEEPEQMLPEQRRTARMILQAIADDQSRRNEEACAGHAVEDEKQASRKEDGESEQAYARSDEPGPSANGHAHQGHALGAQVERGGDEVEGAKKLADAEETDGNGPEILSPAEAGTGVAADRAERGIRGPAGNRRAIRNEEPINEDHQDAQRGPERPHVEARKQNILPAAFDREETL